MAWPDAHNHLAAEFKLHFMHGGLGVDGGLEREGVRGGLGGGGGLGMVSA